MSTTEREASLAVEQHSVPHASLDGPTPSQTIGPFFRFGMDWFEPRDLVAPGSPGAITISGTVFDGAGDPVPDASIEIWQADADGAFPANAPAGVAHPKGGAAHAGGDAVAGPGWVGDGWHGWGRCMTDGSGSFTFTTVKPGSVGGEAPHIAVTLFCRGVLQRLVTRIYFPDETAANAADPALVAAGDRAATLVATADGAGQLHHDIHLQGEHETVFFVW